MLSQDIVDYLNHHSGQVKTVTLHDHPAIQNFVTCPFVIISPVLFDDARRVSVFDGRAGRYVTIIRRTGERRYIYPVPDENITVSDIEQLTGRIKQSGGDCHVERMYIVIDLPSGYLLNPQSKRLGEITVEHERVEDIGL